MAGIRELLAVGLAAALGVVLLVAPRTAVRLSVFNTTATGRRGEYGADGAVPDRWAWVARGLGVACLVAAAAVAHGAVG